MKSEKSPISVKEFLDEVGDYYANQVHSRSVTTCTTLGRPEPMPYVMTAEELVGVVIRWTTLHEAAYGYYVSALEKAYREDFSEIKGYHPNGILPFSWK